MGIIPLRIDSKPSQGHTEGLEGILVSKIVEAVVETSDGEKCLEAEEIKVDVSPDWTTLRGFKDGALQWKEEIRDNYIRSIHYKYKEEPKKEEPKKNEVPNPKIEKAYWVRDPYMKEKDFFEYGNRGFDYVPREQLHIKFENANNEVIYTNRGVEKTWDVFFRFNDGEIISNSIKLYNKDGSLQAKYNVPFRVTEGFDCCG